MRDPALSSLDEGRPGCAQGRLFIRSTVLLHKDFVLKRFCIPPPSNRKRYNVEKIRFSGMFRRCRSVDDRVTRKVEEKASSSFPND